MEILKTDRKGRLTIPVDFANCLIALERRGDELRIHKIKRALPRRYTFRELMAGVTKNNLHPEVRTGSPRGRELL
ncbi:hypothetical protein AYO40_01850 [Planctomycetaceae bacterium SCGC AG-212-D15]|nr:hypothetical protein AYO40_01850 [Planctomycetaceae bacterium SCGC AG-212-D15]